MKPSTTGVDWIEDFLSVVQNPQIIAEEKIIEALVDLMLSKKLDDQDNLLSDFPMLMEFKEELTSVYYRYIIKMEDKALKGIFEQRDYWPTTFTELADDGGLMAYNRVNDMFNFIDFTGCKKFTMIGCGSLPVTAIHVSESTEVAKIICVDISQNAISGVVRLNEALKGSRLSALISDGQTYDFSGSEVIYIANMVSPKIPVIKQLIRTADKGTQVIIREPYSLGKLWADSLDESVLAHFEIIGRGSGSRYLSRDVYLRLN